MSETVQLTAADGFLCPAYVARPDGPARGAVVVLQEIFGVNAHIRAITPPRFLRCVGRDLGP